MGQWGILWGNGGFYGGMGHPMGDPMGQWGFLWGNTGILWDNMGILWAMGDPMG